MSKIDRVRQILREDPRSAVLVAELLAPPVGLRPPGTMTPSSDA